jgi:hypothetical protein
MIAARYPRGFLRFYVFKQRRHAAWAGFISIKLTVSHKQRNLGLPVTNAVSSSAASRLARQSVFDIELATKACK